MHFGEDAPEKNINVTRNQENSTLLQILLKYKVESDDNFVVENILKDLEKKTLCQDLPGFRLMSGYNYPDMTDVDLHWFYTFKKYSPVGAKSFSSKNNATSRA